MKQCNSRKRQSGISRLEVVLVVAILLMSLGAVVLLRSTVRPATQEGVSADGSSRSRSRNASSDWDWSAGPMDEQEDSGEEGELGDLLKIMGTQSTAQVLGRPASAVAESERVASASYRVVTFDEAGGPLLDGDARGGGQSGDGEAAGARKEPERPSALEVLKGLIDSATAHRKSLDYICAEVDAETIGDALALVEQMQWGPEANLILNQLMVRWGQLDPDAAIDYAGSLLSRRARSSAMSKAIGGWAQQDPQAAYRWFSQNAALDPGTLGASVRDLFGQMAKYDESWAWNSLWELPSSSMKHNALRSMIGKKVDDAGRRELMAMYDSRTSSEDKALLAGTIVSSWATYHPDDAASWVSSLTDPIARNAAMRTLVRSWGYDQPESAGNWILTLPAREQRTQMSTLIQTWARVDPFEASDWLEQFQPSPQLDPAVQSLVRTVMRDDPPGAIIWAETITNRRQRESMIQQVANYWMKRDPASCRQYVLNSSLPPKIKARYQ